MKVVEHFLTLGKTLTKVEKHCVLKLGEMTYGIVMLGKLGEMSFGILKLGETSFGMLNKTSIE